MILTINGIRYKVQSVLVYGPGGWYLWALVPMPFDTLEAQTED